MSDTAIADTCSDSVDDPRLFSIPLISQNICPEVSTTYTGLQGSMIEDNSERGFLDDSERGFFPGDQAHYGIAINNDGNIIDTVEVKKTKRI